MKSKIIRFWLGPLPIEELFPKTTPNPFLHWLIHPIKRRVARIYLKLLQKIFGLKVIAIGGSNGKTTTRNFINLLLSPTHRTVSTFDSITSTYNIPTSILKLRPWTKFFICEMSVEYIGDMDFYLWLATPDVAVLTLIEVEHTQFFKSLDNVIKEETKLLKGKWAKIINANTPHFSYQNFSNTKTFGTSEKFTAFIKKTELTPNLTTKTSIEINSQTLTYEIPTPGKHLSHPIAASILVAQHFNINTYQNPNIFTNFKNPPHRLTPIVHKSGAIILDDTYNSNPSSARTAIETASELASSAKKTLILVMSQMNELGALELQEHQKIGSQIKNISSVKDLIAIGHAANTFIKFAGFGTLVNDKSQIITHIKKYLTPTHIILFKSSRGWKLEEVVKQLTEGK